MTPNFLSEKLTGPHLVKKTLAFYGTRRFDPSACPAPQPDEFSPHTSILCLQVILILSSLLRVGIPSGIFPSRFPPKTLYAFLFTTVHATCPAHHILLDLITQIIFGEGLES